MPVHDGDQGGDEAPALEMVSVDHLPPVFTLPDAADPDLLEDFVAEGFDYLEQAEQALLALESDPSDAEAVNVVFRAFHTIKGVSGFLELQHIADLAHHAESLLARVREGELVFSPPVADVTLKSADALRELLEGVRQAMESGGEIRTPRGYFQLLATLADPDQVERLALGESVAVPEVIEEEPEDGGGGAAAAVEGSVRVKTARLDRLLDLVGELVVAHAMVAEDPIVQRDHHSVLARKVSRSEKILRELQDLTTSMRMVPLKPAFRKLARVVRDVSRRAGKPVRLVTEGEETELDRSMVNIITDPLVHMVRNSIDHGIEPAAERRAAGKPESGLVRLSAHQSGGSVVIEIADDGRGLDREKIARKAIDRGIIETDRGLTDQDVYNLIFSPGFSTAEQVTDISGRGVGMDVVKRSVESLRGRIDIESTPGQGSRFIIHLPLTLAITDGMLLRVGCERYIIPMVKIHMSFRPGPGDLYTVAGKGEMVTLHDELLPITRLHRLYDVPDAVEDPSDALLIVVGEGSRRSALMVDELLGQQQFVVKALSGAVADVPGVAGGAILGDGEVGLILDPEELIVFQRMQSDAAA
ncbi:MAG: chemotaxis protein CheA [Gemmatimonadetes bacterium]|nr:MAG: chemotaxis protein CheA [Gemmatimonadota bacterium]